MPVAIGIALLVVALLTVAAFLSPGGCAGSGNAVALIDVRCSAPIIAIASWGNTGHYTLVVANDPGLIEEARRWSGLVQLSFREVPELSGWLDDGWPRTPGMVWIAIVHNCLDLADDCAPRPQYDDVWRRFLRVVEVVEEALDALADDPRRAEDASELSSFSTSGPVCDVTRNQAGLERLLRWMGPKTVDAARTEIGAHQLSRGWDESAINWSSACTDFSSLRVDPRSLLPEPDSV